MCNGGGNSVKKFADGGSTGTKSKKKPAKNSPKPAASFAPNRAEAYRNNALNRAIDRMVQENLSRPLPAEEYVDMPWSEYGSRVAAHVVPSTVNMVTDLAGMAMNPVDTATAMTKGLGQLGYGLGSKALRTAGYEGDQAGEVALDALISDTKGHYGLGEPGKFWKNLAEDPASYGADAAALFTGGASAATKAKKLADVAQLRQYEKFLVENTPEQDVSSMIDRQFYEPNYEELQLMKATPTTIEEAEYWDKMAQSEKLLKQGVSPETVTNLTEILSIPRRSMEGDVLGPDRELYGAWPGTMARLRPDRLNDYGITTVYKDMGKKNYGSFDANTFPPEITINSTISPYLQSQTKEHEMSHADAWKGGVLSQEIGSSPEDTFVQRLNALDSLASRIKAAKGFPDEQRRLKEQYATLRRMTPGELYEANPGEMLARLSSGEDTMARRLTPMQVLNPYINPDVNPIMRGLAALDTAMFSDTTPWITFLQRKFNLPATKVDTYKNVPIDVSKAIIGKD